MGALYFFQMVCQVICAKKYWSPYTAIRIDSSMFITSFSRKNFTDLGRSVDGLVQGALQGGHGLDGHGPRQIKPSIIAFILSIPLIHPRCHPSLPFGMMELSLP